MRHAVYCGTRNVYADMETAAKSLVANSHVDVVHFLIEDAEFPRELPDIVQVHDVSGQQWFRPDGPNFRSRWTWMVLMRAALCHVLDEVDVVLSLDCDTICVDDATDVWDTDLDGYYFAAVKEGAKSRDGLFYANIGVALMNLAKLRDGKADEVIGLLNRCRYTWPEQDAMTYLCQGRIAELDKRYNDMGFNGHALDPCIVHFAGQRNDSWQEDPIAKPYVHMTWDEAMKRHERVGKKLGRVMFTSDHDFDRAENLRAVYDAYDGPKEFVRDTRKMADAPSRYACVVCDTLPRYMPDKGTCKSVVIGHGIMGKKYALDETRQGIDTRAFGQIDVATCPSTHTVDIVAGQFGIDAGKVLPLGMPRTDAYAGKEKGDGHTFLAEFRAYFYAPTYRAQGEGHLPRIDWEALDAELDDGELFVVKRHYFQRDPIVMGDVDHIVEVPMCEPSAPYLVDCDVLITDWSSILFDGYLCGKPAVLLCDDKDEYLSSRGMYLEWPNDYGIRVMAAEGHEAELVETLRSIHGMTDEERAIAAKSADMCDGHSAERVCSLIRELATT